MSPHANCTPPASVPPASWHGNVLSMPRWRSLLSTMSARARRLHALRLDGQGMTRTQGRGWWLHGKLPVAGVCITLLLLFQQLLCGAAALQQPALAARLMGGSNVSKAESTSAASPPAVTWLPSAAARRRRATSSACRAAASMAAGATPGGGGSPSPISITWSASRFRRGSCSSHSARCA